MSEFKFLIRFGVHKDREAIRSLRGSISGMVIPAHILCYSTNATIAAISYIQKDYYIDPMTYLYADQNIKEYVVLNTETKRNSFKPSIAKLTESYGLTALFDGRGFSPLIPEDFTDEFIATFCQKNIDLQTNKIDTDKAGAYKKYSDLLKKVGENHVVEEMETAHTPAAIIPPYFFIGNVESVWVGINLRLAQKTKELLVGTELPVMPVILTDASTLKAELLSFYTDFKDLFLWMDDFGQKQTISVPQEAEYKNAANFIRSASAQNFKIIDLRGTYFSVLLGKLGLKGLCNGVFYGETKARMSSVGGVPPVRYYLRKLHEFYGIAEATQLLKKYPELLDKDCSKCMSLINGSVDDIFHLNSQPQLAQAHFVYSREAEIEDMENNDLAILSKELSDTFDKYARLPSSITTKNVDYLRIWKDSIN